jgi:hypothetical protein
MIALHIDGLEDKETENFLSKDFAPVSTCLVQIRFLTQRHHIERKILHEIDFVQREDLGLKYFQKDFHERVILGAGTLILFAYPGHHPLSDV